MSDYEITEEDIQGMVKYLKVFHPENANHEFAKEMLHYLKATYHRLALTDPDVLDELYDEFTRKD
jgi:hypothetical protein